MQIYAKSQENIEMKKSRNPHKCVVSRLLTESDRRGSNPRSRPWQGRALPTTPLSHKRVMGIEPTYPAWKAGVLPLNYTRRYSVERAIDGARTRGLDLGKVARYQLRHYRISG